MEKSFQLLPSPSKYAYVWVDDIDSRLFGGYFPFPVYLLVGSAYSPFQAQTGRLDRATFEKLSQSTYNAKRVGPLFVSAANVQDGTAVLTFTSGNVTFLVKVLSVTSKLITGDSLQIQLCR